MSIKTIKWTFFRLKFRTPSKWALRSCVGICISMLALPVYAAKEFDDAVKYYKDRRYDVAGKLFLATTDADPANSMAFLYQAHCLAGLGKYDKAELVYNYVVATFKGTVADSEARKGLANLKAARSAASAPAAVSTAAPSPEIAGLGPDDFDIDYEIEHSHFIVNAQINGKPLRAMFDTGAEDCVVAKKHLDQLGLTVPANARSLMVSGASGRGAMARSITAPITVGKLSRTVPVIVLDDASLKEPIIGQEFVRGYQFKIDSRQRQIHFSRSGAVLQPKKVGVTTRGYSVPFTMSGNSLIVDVEVNRKPFKMIFDTGAFETTMAYSHAVELGVVRYTPSATMVVSGSDGAAPACMLKMDRFEFGPIVKTDVPVVVVLKGGPHLPLLSPKIFVNDRNYVIDQEKRVITFY